MEKKEYQSTSIKPGSSPLQQTLFSKINLIFFALFLVVFVVVTVFVVSNIIRVSSIVNSPTNISPKTNVGK